MSGLHVFTLLGVPVYISIWFVVIVAYWGLSAGDLASGLTWGAIITVSILVHEFGHAMVARHYGLQPRVLLHGWGGLCAHERAEKDRHDAFIIAAGPAAGLLLGAVAWGVRASGALTGLEPVRWLVVDHVFRTVVWVNIFWSLVNLLPLWPLDGGQLFRLGIVRWLGGARGERVAHWAGVAVGVGAAVAAKTLMNSTFIMVGGLFLAWMNYEQIRRGGVSGTVRPQYRYARSLFEQAQAAYDGANFREAARLCHQIRSLASLSDEIMLATWELLALSTAHTDEPELALRYADRARPGPAVHLARARAFVALGRLADARDELEAVTKVPSNLRAEAAELAALTA